jgi:hypothetical protein
METENPAKIVEIIVSETWQKKYQSVVSGSEQIKGVIQRALENGHGALIGRNGTIELTCFLLYNKEKKIDSERLKTLELNAGVFFSKPTEFPEWFAEYKKAVNSADVLACGWYAPLARPELQNIQTENPGAIKIPLRSLEPYYVEGPSWLNALENQHVAIVSSFTESIQEQVDILDRIWRTKPELFPVQVNWSFVRSFYSPVLGQGKCQWPTEIKSWKDAVDFLEQEVINTGAKICLIGCGGLGMPLASRLKSKGIIAIVMGGAIQILFGIKGRRWENHSVISEFFNSDWMWPKDSEIPNGAKQVEGGCYW